MQESLAMAESDTDRGAKGKFCDKVIGSNLKLKMPENHQKDDEQEGYTWTCGRQLGFELLFKSKCTWFYATKNEILTAGSSGERTAARARSIQRQFSNSGSLLSRRKRQAFSRCFRNVPLGAVLATVVLFYVLYYQTLTALTPVEKSYNRIVPLIEVIQIDNATFGGSVHLPRVLEKGRHVRREFKDKSPEQINLKDMLQMRIANHLKRINNSRDLLSGNSVEVHGVGINSLEIGIRSTGSVTSHNKNPKCNLKGDSDQKSLDFKLSNMASTRNITEEIYGNLGEQSARIQIRPELTKIGSPKRNDTTQASKNQPSKDKTDTTTSQTETKSIKQSTGTRDSYGDKVDSLSKGRKGEFQTERTRSPGKDNKSSEKLESERMARTEIKSTEEKSDRHGNKLLTDSRNTDIQNKTKPIKKNKRIKKTKGSNEKRQEVHEPQNLDKGTVLSDETPKVRYNSRFVHNDHDKSKNSSEIRIPSTHAIVSTNKVSRPLESSKQPQPKPVSYKSDQNYSEKHRLMVLFTSFKRDPSRYRIHFNVIRNWASFRPAVVPVLFNDSTNPALLDMAVEAGWVIRKVPAYNANGVPLLRAMYQDLQPFFGSSMFIGYANGDILFDEGLITTLEGITRKQRHLNETMVVGMRHNLFLQKRRLFWPHDVWLAVKNEALQAPVYAEDYFFIYRNKFPWHILPELVIGRPAYDNYLVAVAIKNNVSVVDASRTISCIHQYGPGGLGAGRKNRDAAYNRDIIGDFNYHDGYLDQAPFETTFDPKGKIFVWERNKERQDLLNSIRRHNMSSQWRENPKLYMKFVDYLKPGHKSEVDVR